MYCMVGEKSTPRKWDEVYRAQRREMMRKMQTEDLNLEVGHPQAAGIDIGNESHYVAVPPSLDPQTGAMLWLHDRQAEGLF
jgi:hypothetical protein